MGSPPLLRIQWLGQAGFLCDAPGLRVLVDPYLSDSLAEKYQGSKFSHQRMQAVPITPEALFSVDYYLVTHHHGDHFDTQTVVPILKNNPQCQVLLPAAYKESAKAAVVPVQQLVTMDAFCPFASEGIEIYPIPAAHEALTIDDAGHHLFLGYVIKINGITLYHSGDCVPYPGLKKNLSPFSVDLALLPVNGRDTERTEAGVLGNFTLDEALDLSEQLGFAHTIGHHYGLFDFNTIDYEKSQQIVNAHPVRDRFWLATMPTQYEFYDCF